MQTVTDLPGGGVAIVEKGILSRCGDIFRGFSSNSKVAVVTDETVRELYFDVVKSSLEACGFVVCDYTITPGENSKNWNEAGKIASFLARNGLTGGDTVVTLGGGVAGDLGAFVSSIYHRGIRLCAMPTTILAAIDSSVGGKTAVNFPEGKNLAGTFWQPALVLCDVSVFGTLGETELAEGMGELCKYSLLTGEKFDVKSLKNTEKLTEMIKKCIAFKSEIVKKDVFDKNERRILNLGHTYAHAVESAGGYVVPHGIAVFYGVKKTVEVCFNNGFMSKAEYLRCREVISDYPEPVVALPGNDEIKKYILADKKRNGEEITLALLNGFGKPFLKTVSVPEAVELLCR